MTSALALGKQKKGLMVGNSMDADQKWGDLAEYSDDDKPERLVDLRSSILLFMAQTF